MSDDWKILWPIIAESVEESLAEDKLFRELATEDRTAFKMRALQVLERLKPDLEEAIEELEAKIGSPSPRSSVENILQWFALGPMEMEQAAMRNALDEFLEESVQGDLVIFVGAGMSFESDIGWITVGRTLGNIFRVPHRELDARIFNDIPARCAELTASQTAQFREIVSRYVRNRNSAKPNDAHRLLAQLLAKKEPGHLICFNWDNFIEEEYTKITGIALTMDAIDRALRPTDWFWKPHGCITRHDLAWVLPHQDVQIPNELSRQLQEPTPRIVICLGFRGSDRFTKEHLITWFGTATPIYDARPGVTSEDALGDPLPFTAKTVLQRLLERH